MEKQNKSNRTYTVRICKNPNCGFGKEYDPTWFTQIYCRTQCRLNFHNDQRREKAAGSHRDEKLLRQTDDILFQINQKCAHSDFSITDDLLKYEGVDTSLGVKQETNKDSKLEIRWFYLFGLEFIPEKAQYIIRKRNKNK